MDQNTTMPPWHHFNDGAQDADILSTPIVTFVVGKEKREFYAHQGILVSSSPYFKSCLEGGFKEATTKRIELPEDDVSGFKLLITWLYTDQFKQKYLFDDPGAFVSMRAWTLGDKFMIPEFQNRILSRLWTYWSNCDNMPMDPEFFQWTLEHLPLTSQLYRAVKHMFIYHIAASHNSYKDNGKWEKEFAELLTSHNDAMEELFWHGMEILRMKWEAELPSYLDYRVTEEQHVTGRIREVTEEWEGPAHCGYVHW
ncbi:hypothetical protein LTR40_000407 [Exophiala xenobiotica]|nr:hypothetical protein LTR40_000407 [Exophiala xenobiotica]